MYWPPSLIKMCAYEKLALAVIRAAHFSIVLTSMMAVNDVMWNSTIRPKLIVHV